MQRPSQQQCIDPRAAEPMSRSSAVFLTLVAYSAIVLAIGAWASRRTRDTGDFFLGGRRLGAVVAALSQAASASSAWTLLGVSGAAFAWGLSAVWIWFAVMAGYVLNWFYVAPRLRILSIEQGSTTLSQVIGAGLGERMRPRVMQSASLIILISFLFYVAAQFQAAGHAFAAGFELSAQGSIVLGTAVVVAYTLLGGFWAASVSDCVQGVMMVIAAVVVPLIAVFAAGGFDQLWLGLQALGPESADLFGDRPAIVATAFVIGIMGIGLASPGQPHVVNRFMAVESPAAVARARWIALAWIAIVLAGMLLAGLAARVLFHGLPDAEQAFFELANRLLPPTFAAVTIVAVLSALMSTTDSQLLVAASCVTVDLKRSPTESLAAARFTVLVFSVLAMLIALYLPESVYSRVLFAWNALGAAFGPLLLVRLAGKRVRPGSTLGAMWAGFLLTVLFYLLPDSPGDLFERVIPFMAALGIALTGGERRRDPDRADRAETTVHDRAAI
ncbi:MAG TPA: sodium/proline symporter [Steroidobacteraceae bacterium]|nr:sodium/proline symporter [Steroidobacteraceae bacterium]